MVKESGRDGSLKKKRKSATSADNETDVDIYKKSVEFEEKEALSRPNDADAQIYFNTCKEIRQLFSEISELKMKNNPDAKIKIMEKNDRGVFVVGPFEEIESYGKSEVSFSEGATSG
jgi:THO complex subunit 5